MEATTANNQESTGYPRIDLPPRLQRMVTEKRQLRLQWQRIRAPTLKTKLNELTEKLRNEMKEYRESPEMWRRRHRQRPVSPQPAANQTARTGKYPTIVVESFPNMVKHLKNLSELFGKSPYAVCRRGRIQFVPRDGPEYHAVVKYLNDIQATETELEYVIRPLNVCIRGLPSSLCIESVKTACTERGYLVDQINQITTNLCYVKLCGGKDNTKILEMRELLTFRVRVELWKSGPVKREMEHIEPTESVASSSSNTTWSVAPALIPPPIPEYLAAQSTTNQAASSEEAITAQYPSILVKSFPNMGIHFKNIKQQLGRYANCVYKHNRIRFFPSDGSEYHAVVKYLKSIETTEPGLQYFISPLSVCIRGFFSCISTEDVRNACTDRGYLVDYVKKLTAELYYVKICGGKDNTKILEIGELLGYPVWVELWSSDPVGRGMEPREPNESVSRSASDKATSVAPVPTIPLPREHSAVQPTGSQVTNSDESTAKYPAIIVEPFPNWPTHLENIEKEFGRTAYAEAWYHGIRFVPLDGPEYHAVIKYLKSIEATEPGLKYIVRSLDVCIYGLPNYISTEEVKTACTERGYVVDHVKQIPTTSVFSLHYIKICGRKDNTKILEMRELLGYAIKVELWRGGPVKKEKKSISSAVSNAETSGTSASTVPLFQPEYIADLVAQSVKKQVADSIASALFPQLVPERLAAQSAEHQTSAPAPAFPPRRSQQAAMAGQSAEHQTSAVQPHRAQRAAQAAQSAEPAPPVPPRSSSLAVPAGQSSAQTPATAGLLPAITPDQLAALTAQITALTLTAIQIFSQPRKQ